MVMVASAVPQIRGDTSSSALQSVHRVSGFSHCDYIAHMMYRDPKRFQAGMPSQRQLFRHYNMSAIGVLDS